jgi:signal transduction histidine kinase
MNALISYTSSGKIKDKNSKWHIFMSIFIGIYTFFLGINTHITNEHISNSILLGHWIVSYLALFCYLNAIEFYLQKKIEVLIYPKIVFLGISSIYIVSMIVFQFTGTSIFLTPITEQVITNYSKYSHITTMGSLLGVTIGYFGIIWIVFGSFIIWKELSKTTKNEYMLKLGIILCLTIGAYDTAIGLGHLKTQLPLFYLGFALESVRFMLHTKKLSIQELAKLNNEVDKLSKVAQFGIATASISHDIRNHLHIIKSSLSLLQKMHEPKYIELAEKHANEIHNISDLYTDLFKKNLRTEKEKISLANVFENVEELTAKKIKHNKTKLEIEHNDDFSIIGNETELTLCIVNLVNNSIDAISSQAERWIKISTSPDKKVLKVQDSGLGIEKEHADKIFEYDFSTKQNEGGTGLGLAIVKQILSKYGYQLKYNNDYENTTFEIHL